MGERPVFAHCRRSVGTNQVGLFSPRWPRRFSIAEKQNSRYDPFMRATNEAQGDRRSLGRDAAFCAGRGRMMNKVGPGFAHNPLKSSFRSRESKEFQGNPTARIRRFAEPGPLSAEARGNPNLRARFLGLLSAFDAIAPSCACGRNSRGLLSGLAPGTPSADHADGAAVRPARRSPGPRRTCRAWLRRSARRLRP